VTVIENASSRDGRDLTIGQQRHDPPPFQIANDRPVAMIAPERPVVDADDGKWLGSRPCPPTHDAQKRVIAHRHHQPLSEAGRRSAAEGDASAAFLDASRRLEAI
jgi:hypothetical protein